MEKSKEQQLKAAQDENKSIKAQNQRLTSAIKILKYSIEKVQRELTKAQIMINNINSQEKPDEENEKTTFGGF